MVVIMGKQIEKQENGRVVVKYNGPTGWDINFVGRGKVAVRPGENVELDPHEVTQLRALLTIVKEINRPYSNERVRLKPPTPSGFKAQEMVPRFEYVSGKELLPEVLQKHSYSASNMFTDAERNAVLDLCPKYFDETNPKKKQQM